jgi:hypothetical protein
VATDDAHIARKTSIDRLYRQHLYLPVQITDLMRKLADFRRIIKVQLKSKERREQALSVRHTFNYSCMYAFMVP